jgi:hypothetical protein
MSHLGCAIIALCAVAIFFTNPPLTDITVLIAFFFWKWNILWICICENSHRRSVFSGFWTCSIKKTTYSNPQLFQYNFPLSNVNHVCGLPLVLAIYVKVGRRFSQYGTNRKQFELHIKKFSLKYQYYI